MNDKLAEGLTEPTGEQLQSFACRIARKCPHSNIKVISDEPLQFQCQDCGETGYHSRFEFGDSPDYLSDSNAVLEDVIPKAGEALGKEDWRLFCSSVCFTEGKDGFCNDVLMALWHSPLGEQYRETLRSESGENDG